MRRQWVIHPFDEPPRIPERFGTGGFSPPDGIHFSRKDRVMIRFFGQLRVRLNEENRQKDSVEATDGNRHQERV
jgi:hypothetical protein